MMVYLFLLASLFQMHVLPGTSLQPASHPEIAFRARYEDGIPYFVCSPNGKFLATPRSGHTIQLLDAQNGELLHTLPLPAVGIASLVFSPDSATLACVASSRGLEPPAVSQVLLWDTATGKFRRPLGSGIDHSYLDDTINDMVYSPDGTLLAVSIQRRDGAEGGVDLWEERTGVLRRHLDVRRAAIVTLAFSPDGGTIAGTFWPAEALGGKPAGDAERGILLWDVGTGALRHTLSTHGAGVSKMAFSPDGALLAGACQTNFQPARILLWETRTGAEKRSLAWNDTWVSVFAFSPDGKTLASANIESAPFLRPFTGSNPGRATEVIGHTLLWDLTADSPARVLPEQGWISSLAYSPDGSRLATVASEIAQPGQHTLLSLWNPKTAALLHQIAIVKDIGLEQVRYLPDGKTLVMSGSMTGDMRWFHAATLKMRTLIPGQPARFVPIAFSPDGSLLASGGHRGESALLWNIRTGRLERRLPRPTAGWVNALAFAPDGKTLATLTPAFSFDSVPGALQVWDLKTGQCRYNLKKTPEPEWVTYSDGSRTPVHRTGSVPALWHTLVFSPDGASLISGGKDNGGRNVTNVEHGKEGLRWWDMQSGKPGLTPQEDTGEVYASAISPNGRLLATSGWYETILWDAVTGKQIRRMRTLFEGGAPAEPYREAEMRTLAFSPDGQTLASGDTNRVRLWDVATGSERAQWEGHLGPICAVAFSPDGALLASASEDRTVRLWNVASGTTRRLLVHDCAVTSVAFSPDGRLLASGSNEGKLRLWNPETGALLLTIEVFPTREDRSAVTWIAYTPEGYYEGSPDIKDYLRWRVEDRLLPARTFERQFHRPDRVQAALQAK